MFMADDKVNSELANLEGSHYQDNSETTLFVECLYKIRLRSKGQMFKPLAFYC